MIHWGTKYRHWLFWVTRLFILLTIIAFVWRDWSFSVSHPINGAKVGQLGDFLSGTLGTIFAGISLILMVATLRVQEGTLFVTKSASEFEFVNSLYDRISQEIADARHLDFKGIDAFYKFELDAKGDVKFLDTLNLILSTYEMFMSYVEKMEFVDEDLRPQSLKRLNLLFYSKVLWPLHTTIIENGEKFVAGLYDDSRILIPKYARISVKRINYLLDQNMVARSDWKDEKMELLKKIEKLNSRN